jgi:HAD superfamily hydrolase (TIGR01509 family)
MIKAIIFDLDDLMVHSSPLHFKAFKHAFSLYEIDTDKMDDAAQANLFGLSIPDIVDAILDYFKSDADRNEILKIRDELFLKLVQEDLQPMPGLATLTKNVKDWGFRRALASSGQRNYIDVALKKVGLEDYFEKIVTGDDVKHTKPAPDVFILAAKQLGLPPDECCVIEDAAHGITAAKSAGMKVIGVDNSLIELKQNLSKADLVVNRLDEITLEHFTGISNDM